MSLLLDETGSLSAGYLVFAGLTAAGTIFLFLIRNRCPDGPDSKILEKNARRG